MDKTFYDWTELILKNISAWPILACAVLLWISQQKELIQRFSKISFHGFELELAELKEAVKQSKLEIGALENDIETERRNFDEILRGFNPHSPVSDLQQTSKRLKANARTIENLDILSEMLNETAGSEQLYAAAATLRERRPTQHFNDLISCLDRLAASDDLGGIRLNTVWALTSAVHRILMASIRDNIKPRISHEDLKKANEVLDRLERNPRVQNDRPDNPKKGVRGPIYLARNWIERGLND